MSVNFWRNSGERNNTALVAELQAKIQGVTARLYTYGVLKTPLLALDSFSKLAGKPVFLKDESRQKFSSFKIRGVVIEVEEAIIARLAAIRQNPSLHGRPYYLVTQSTGNHGIAMIGATRLVLQRHIQANFPRIEPIVFTLHCTPPIKKTQMKSALYEYREMVGKRRWGAVQDMYDSYEDAHNALQHFVTLRPDHAAVMEHACPAILSGHASIGEEVAAQLGKAGIPEDRQVALLVPVGAGGSLAISVGCVLQRPHTTVIAVQTIRTDALIRTLLSDQMQSNQSPASTITVNGQGFVFEDGINVNSPEPLAIEVAKQFADLAVAVDAQQAFEKTAPRLYRDVKAATAQIPYIGGTTAIAGQALLDYLELPEIQEASAVVLIATEGNIDPAINIAIAQRAQYNVE